MKKENNLFNTFFNYLSTRGNENYLSDVISAACNSCNQFKKLFLDFFFPNEDLMNKCPSEIEREFSIKKGKYRFDFYFTTAKGDEYIIENKIYDTNDHYNDYKDIPFENIGFIANYDIQNIKYIHKYTWKEFYDYLRKNMEYAKGEELVLLESILSYIRGACGIMEKRDFYLNKLDDLGYIVKVLKELLKEANFEINNKAKGSNEYRIGFWSYKVKSYWFGIYLSNDNKDGFSIWGGIYNYTIKNKASIKRNRQKITTGPNLSKE